MEAVEELGCEETKRFNLCLLGRLWTDSTFNAGALQATIKQIWRVKDGVEIRIIGDNLFSCQFFTWRDKERVIQGEPWWFDKTILVLCEMKVNEQPSSLRPHNTPFWVRVCDVPFNLRSEAVVKQIGDMIGDFMEWDNRGDDKWGSFLRLGVLIDLKKPLRRGTILRNKEGSKFKISFKYERLLDFCYYCGRVGHLMKQCGEKEQVKSEITTDMPFGPWLRASPVRGRQFTTRDEGKNTVLQRMIFKPESEEKTQRPRGVKDVAEDFLRDQEISREGRTKSKGVLDSEPDSHVLDKCLNKEQASVLTAILKSLSNWHISSIGQDTRLALDESMIHQLEGSSKPPKMR